MNDSSDIDRGWTVELAFPWSGMRTLAQGRSLPPRDGDVWRMDFSRFEALPYNDRVTDPSIGWSFNKHGVYDSHIPECFPCVHFSDTTAQNKRADARGWRRRGTASRRRRVKNPAISILQSPRIRYDDIDKG